MKTITNKAILLKQLEIEDWQGDVPILISPEAFEALRGFLYTDVMGTGEGYSLFILRAVAMRRAAAMLKVRER